MDAVGCEDAAAEIDERPVGSPGISPGALAYARPGTSGEVIKIGAGTGIHLRIAARIKRRISSEGGLSQCGTDPREPRQTPVCPLGEVDVQTIGKRNRGSVELPRKTKGQIRPIGQPRPEREHVRTTHGKDESALICKEPAA